MDSLDIFSEQKIRYRGVFCWGELYQYIFDYFEKREYLVSEDKYQERDIGENGSVINMKCTAMKEVTPLVRRRLIVEVEAYDVEEVPVQTEHGEKNLTDGRIIFTFTGYADLDYRGIFETDGWFGKLGPKLYNFIRNGPTKKYFGPNYYAPVYRDTAKLRGGLQSILGKY